MELDALQKRRLAPLVVKAMNTHEARRLKRHLAGEASGKGPAVADALLNEIVAAIRIDMVAYVHSLRSQT